MEVKISKTPDSIEVAIIGRLDTLTAPELDQTLKPIIATTDLLIFECADLEYVSSSGLRVILFTQKMQSAAGKKFLIRNLNREVRSVFDLTGFSKIITIE
jgi:anti-anti-sigma factor